MSNLNSCVCQKLNGYIIRTCAEHFRKRKTIFQLYKELKIENKRLRGRLFGKFIEKGLKHHASN